MGEVRKIAKIIEEVYRESIDHRELKDIDSMVYRTIDREVVENDDSSPSQYRQRAIAERLLEKLEEPKSWKFYLKCAYHLSEDRIWTLVELAMRPYIKDHNRYFVCLANKEMNK